MDIKNVSYNMVLSHTFPGILLEMEIFLTFQLFSPANIIHKVSVFAQSNISNLLSSIALFAVFATILGFMLDGIHHFIFRKQEDDTYGIYSYITTLERMQIARGFLDDDLWYPYEAYANIWIAMMPGLILLPYWMFSLDFHLAFITCIMTVYIVVFDIMRREALSTLEMYKNVEVELMKAFMNSNSQDRTGAKAGADSE